MPSTAPPSSPPVLSMALSSGGSPKSGHLSTPQLPYRNIEKLSETPGRRLDHWVRPSSPIAPSESLNTDLLAAFDHSDEDIDFGQVDDELASEAAANQAFFEENSSSYSTFDSDSDDSDSDDSDFNKLAQNEDESSQYTHSYSAFRSCNSSYAREKLIKILKGEVVVPKQRWGIDRILATLSYQRKDPRLRSSYRRFKQFAYHTLLAKG